MRSAEPRARTRSFHKYLAAGVAVLGLGGLVASSSTVPAAAATNGKKISVALILSTYINPYWIFMHNATEQEAKKLGVNLTFQAGQTEGDTSSQITAIDNAIAAGDQGIIIRANGPAVNSALSQAEKAGISVVAVDTVPTPANIVQMTYATNNNLAGQLIGRYAEKRLDGKPAVIAVLDDVTNEVLTVDVDRNHGFLSGMGIPVGKPGINGFEPTSGHYADSKGGTYQIACELPTSGRSFRRAERDGDLPRKEPQHQPRLYDQRAERAGSRTGARGGEKAPDRRHHRRELREPALYQERVDRRDFGPVSRQNGPDRPRCDRRPHRKGNALQTDARPQLLQHWHGALHRSACRRRAQRHGREGQFALLGQRDQGFRVVAGDRSDCARLA